MGRRSRSSSHSSISSSQSRSLSPSEGYRVHIGDLGVDVSKRDIEKQFGKFGSLLEVWMAKNPPCFAFIVYRHKEDAEQAVKDMNGADFHGHRMRVSLALPRSRGRRRTGFDPNLRCYSCGERGHFSRDCNGIFRFRNRLGGDSPRSRRSRSPPPARSRQGRSRSRDRKQRSWSPRAPKRRARSRSRSPERRKRTYSSHHDRSSSRGRELRKW